MALMESLTLSNINLDVSIDRDSTVIDLGNISSSSEDNSGIVDEPAEDSNGKKIPTGDLLSSPNKLKEFKTVQVKDYQEELPIQELYKRPSETRSIRSDSSSVKRNASAASHLKNTQQLIKDNKKSRKKPKITVNSQFRNPRKKCSEYRNLDENEECSEECDCYYCALLNISSDSSDDEDRFVSDDEIDSIALAYGFPANKPSNRCTCPHGMNNYRKTTKTCVASENQTSKSKSKQHHQQTSKKSKTSKPIIGDGFGDCNKKEIMRDNSSCEQANSMKTEKKFVHAKNCPSQTGTRMIKEMPQFIREFEEAMRQAREESISDSIFDALIVFFEAIFSFCRFFWNRLVTSTPKVGPHVYSTFPKLPQ